LYAKGICRDIAKGIFIVTAAGLTVTGQALGCWLKLLEYMWAHHARDPQKHVSWAKIRTWVDSWISCKEGEALGIHSGLAILYTVVTLSSSQSIILEPLT